MLQAEKDLNVFNKHGVVVNGLHST